MAQTDGPPAYSLPIHAAEQLRAAGRELALAGDHEAALAKYTEAAAAFARAGFAKGVGVCLTNRAIVAGKLGLWAEAYCDAARGARAFPGHAKAWFRGRGARGARQAARGLEPLLPRGRGRREAPHAQCTPRIQRCREASWRGRGTASRALVAVDEADAAPPPLAPVPRPRPRRRPGSPDRPRRGAVRPPLAGAARGLGARSAAACPSARPTTGRRLGAGRGARRRRGAAPRGAREGARRRRRRRHPLAWLPYARAVLEVAPATLRRLRRERRRASSRGLLTEAGARRRTEHGDAPGFGAANPSRTTTRPVGVGRVGPHAAEPRRGDEARRDRAFYDAYYAACAELEREFPANVRTRRLRGAPRVRGGAAPPCEQLAANRRGSASARTSSVPLPRARGRRLRPWPATAERLDDDDDEARRRRRRRRGGRWPRRARAPDARRMLAVVVPMGARPGDKVNFTFRGVAIQATVPAGSRRRRFTCPRRTGRHPRLRWFRPRRRRRLP